MPAAQCLLLPSGVQKEVAGSDMAATGYGCHSVPNSAHNITIRIILVMYSHYHNSRHKQIIYTSTTDSHRNQEYGEENKIR